MTPAERHLATAGAVAADILANWGADPAFAAAAGDECVRSYGRVFEFKSDPPRGRMVLPEPTGTTGEALARGVPAHRYPVRVLVLERYTGKAADAPNGGVDTRLRWVEGPFDRPQDEACGPAAGDAAALNAVDPLTAEPLYAYDPDLLAELKTFASAFQVVYGQRDDDA